MLRKKPEVKLSMACTTKMAETRKRKVIPLIRVSKDVYVTADG